MYPKKGKEGKDDKHIPSLASMKEDAPQYS